MKSLPLFDTAFMSKHLTGWRRHLFLQVICITLGWELTKSQSVTSTACCFLSPHLYCIVYCELVTCLHMLRNVCSCIEGCRRLCRLTLWTGLWVNICDRVQKEPRQFWSQQYPPGQSTSGTQYYSWCFLYLVAHYLCEAE